MFKNLWNNLKSKLGMGEQPVANTENHDHTENCGHKHSDHDAAYTNIKHCHNGLLDDSGLSVNEIENCWRHKETVHGAEAPALVEAPAPVKTWNSPETWNTLESDVKKIDEEMTKITPAEPIQIVSAWEHKPKSSKKSKSSKKKTRIDVELTSASTEVVIPKKKSSKSKPSKKSKSSKGSKKGKKN